MATVNEALDAAASMIAEFAIATVRKGIVSAGQLILSDVEVSSTCDVNRVLEQSFPTRMLKMSSVVLVLAFLEMQKPSHSQHASSPLGHHYRSGSFEEIARIYGYRLNYQQPFQRDDGQPL